MSRAQIASATLDRYKGPFFTDQTSRLHDALDAIGGFHLGTMRDALEGLTAEIISRPNTSDGYCWFCTIVFHLNRQDRIAVLIPHGDDPANTDGSRLGRAPALYFKFDFLRGQERHLLAHFVSRLETANERRPQMVSSLTATGLIA